MNNLDQKRKRLPFFKTMWEVATIRKEERVDRATVRKVLRFGVNSWFGRIAILLGAISLIVVPLIFLNVVYTFLDLMPVAGMLISVIVVQSDRGARAVSRGIDFSRSGIRMLAYPVTYLRLVDEYESSSIITAEDFYQLRRFRKEVGERQFNPIKNLCAKFPASERKKLLYMSIALAYEMSKQRKNVRLILYTLIPAALELLLEGVGDCESNLAVVEHLLRSYDISFWRTSSGSKVSLDFLARHLLTI